MMNSKNSSIFAAVVLILLHTLNNVASVGSEAIMPKTTQLKFSCTVFYEDSEKVLYTGSLESSTTEKALLTLTSGASDPKKYPSLTRVLASYYENIRLWQTEVITGRANYSTFTTRYNLYLNTSQTVRDGYIVISKLIERRPNVGSSFIAGTGICKITSEIIDNL